MCGRYFIDKETLVLIEEWLSDDEDIKTGDIHPGDPGLVIVNHQGHLQAKTMRWGLPFKGRLMINARLESVTSKPAFQVAVASRRCVIVAAAFYEWSDHKDKVTFSSTRHQPLFMGGYYDDEEHFIIITTPANESVAPVHHRMPLLLQGREVSTWLKEGTLYHDFLKMPTMKLKREQRYEQLSLFHEDNV